VSFIQRIHPKTLGKLVNLSCYVTNQSLHNDLDMPFVKDEFRRLAMAYNKHFLRQGKDSIARSRNGSISSRRIKEQGHL